MIERIKFYTNIFTIIIVPIFSIVILFMGINHFNLFNYSNSISDLYWILFTALTLFYLLMLMLDIGIVYIKVLKSILFEFKSFNNSMKELNDKNEGTQ